jgi:hypothetical protein
MAAGKILSFLGGLLTLIGMYIFNWLTISNSAIETSLGVPAGGLASIGVGSASFIYAIAALKKIAWFLGADFQTLLTKLSTNSGITFPSWVVYVILVIVIIFCLSGIFQILGMKVRALAIIGGLLPLAYGVIFILGAFNITIPYFAVIQLFTVICFGDTTALVPQFLPMSMNVLGVGLGLLIFTIGSLLSFISGFMKREDI